MTQHLPDETKMSRRRLLKLVAATGGAVAASGLVPAQWITPVVNVGILPVLAQDASPVVEIEFREEDIEDGPLCEEGEPVFLFLDYYDPTGGITGDTELCISTEIVDLGGTIEKTYCTTLDEYCADNTNHASRVFVVECWTGGAKKGSIFLGWVCAGKECEFPPGVSVTVLIWLDNSNVLAMPRRYLCGGIVGPVATLIESAE
jgi:hypothetical protein